MMNWYITRDDCNLVHRGQTFPPKVKLFLSSEQAKLHNTEREQVVECEPPASEKEVGVLADLVDFKNSPALSKDDAQPEEKTQSKSDRRRAQNPQT